VGLSQLWDKVIGEEPEQAVSPAQTPDAQALYGNSFLACNLFGGSGEEDKAALRQMVEEVREGVDRQMAEDELREKLHVGEGAADGQAAVSQEEFDEMAALYSDIRRGKTDIQFDLSRFGDNKEAAEAFKNGTMADLSSIMQTPSGRAMLKELAHSENGTKVTLGKANDPDHPETSPLYKGRTFEQLDMDERWAQKAELDQNKPVSSRIEYAPGQTVHTDHSGDVRSDVALYHELAHAYHFGKGDTVKGGKQVGDHYVDNSELQTTQGWHGDERYTENKYRWERRTGLGEDLPRRETYGGRDVDEGPRDKKCPVW
jgi:hypothetical protein